MQLGIERLLSDKSLTKRLSGLRISLVAHPASVNRLGQHSLDLLANNPVINVTSAFGPQHGMRGEKQDNMIETDNYLDPVHKIPVFSLYGEVRRPTQEMLDSFDVLLVDIQDIGCRIYTYITTLLYLLEACAENGKTIIILDRPNPAGREHEGLLLQAGWESFVGAGEIIMRHGLTLGEMAKWFVQHHSIDVDLTIVEMHDYDINSAPGYGWPDNELPWVNPSPNAASVNMTRFYAGSVLLEGTELSEGRGTTIALEVAGAPDIDIYKVLTWMESQQKQWLQGAIIRPCYFEPTFHKHASQLCQGFQIHTDTRQYQPSMFKPYRLTLLFLKAIYNLYPGYKIWRQFDYEYETKKLPFDVINGGTTAREWIEDNNASCEDFEKLLLKDEKKWESGIQECFIY